MFINNFIFPRVVDWGKTQAYMHAYETLSKLFKTKIFLH